MGSYSKTVSGGVDSVPSYGQNESYIFASTWVAGDTWFLECVSSIGSFSIGRTVDVDGNAILVGTSPTNGLVLRGRVYLATGSRYIFCDNNDPTGWYEQNPGAGYISLLSEYGGQDSVTALASYQGMLAAFLRNSIQIWKVDSDPVNFSQKQVLSNIGTAYGFSVQSIGDGDVLFLADSGVRSLRVRDSSLNAVTTDIGSPVDSLVKAVLAAGSFGTPLSTVEPTSSWYWLYLNGTIYVLSYFADSTVRAWSTYKPTVGDVVTVVATGNPAVNYALTAEKMYHWVPTSGTLTSGSVAYTTDSYFIATAATAVASAAGIGVLTCVTQQTFVPSKFVISNGSVYCRANAALQGAAAADYLVAYGGGYDTCIATVESSFLSLKSPSTNKYARGLDLAITGTWTVSISMDQTSAQYETVGTLLDPTFDSGVVALQTAGTHAAFKLVSGGAVAALLSSFSLSFDPGELQ